MMATTSVLPSRLAALQVVFAHILQQAARTPRDVFVLRFTNVGPGQMDGALTGLNETSKRTWRVARIQVRTRDCAASCTSTSHGKFHCKY